MSLYDEPDDLKVWRLPAAWGGIVGASHRGLKRSNNEDRYGVSLNGITIALADGMGGHPAGEVAAEAAVRAVVNMPESDGTLPPVFAFEAIRRAQNAVAPLAAFRREQPSPGSTLVVARIDPMLRHVAIGWAGDSRAYLFAVDHLARITRDHTDPRFGTLTQAIGGGSATSAGEVEFVGVPRGGWLLLCSDGLHGCVSDEAIRAALCAAQGFREIAVRRLIGRAFAAGAPDNVTCMIVSFA